MTEDKGQGYEKNFTSYIGIDCGLGSCLVMGAALRQSSLCLSKNNQLQQLCQSNILCRSDFNSFFDFQRDWGCPTSAKICSFTPLHF